MKVTRQIHAPAALAPVKVKVRTLKIIGNILLLPGTEYWFLGRSATNPHFATLVRNGVFKD
jgi:hypothetical protein